MKIRNGFVSNSSSSSFVIALDKSPMDMDVQELRELLFGEQELFAKYDYASTTLALSETILTDLQLEHKREKKEEDNYHYGVKSVKGKMSKDDLVENIACGWFDGHPDFFSNHYHYETEDLKIENEAKKQGIEKPNQDPKWGELIRKARNKRYAEEDRINREAAMKLADPFWEKHKDKYLYALEYSDNEGSQGVILEHGGVFDRIPHITISHH